METSKAPDFSEFITLTCKEHILSLLLSALEVFTQPTSKKSFFK